MPHHFFCATEKDTKACRKFASRRPTRYAPVLRIAVTTLTKLNIIGNNFAFNESVVCRNKATIMMNGKVIDQNSQPGSRISSRSRSIDNQYIFRTEEVMGMSSPSIHVGMKSICLTH